MDHQSDLEPPGRAAREIVLCDQAVFTSARSPLGEGYRIVAASPGIAPDERTEITKRSPSHGSLCGNSSTAVGFSYHQLTSGRYCLAHSRYAGTEHTARGGQRVHTHIVVLDCESFRRFQYNCICVHRALADIICRSPTGKLPARLAPVTLPVTSPQATSASPRGSSPGSLSDLDLVCHILSVVLAEGQLIVVGADNPFQVLEWTLLALPLSLRRKLSVSVGLRYSAARPARLVFTDKRGRTAQRMIAGRDIRWLEVGSLPPQQPCPCEGWLELIRERWNKGRFSEIAQLTSKLSDEIQPGDLDRIALTCREKDTVAAQLGV